jgi:hypothetical protein
MIEEMCGQWLFLMINKVEMITITHLRIVINKRNKTPYILLWNAYCLVDGTVLDF